MLKKEHTFGLGTASADHAVPLPVNQERAWRCWTWAFGGGAKPELATSEPRGRSLDTGGCSSAAATAQLGPGWDVAAKLSEVLLSDNYNDKTCSTVQ